jgi:hypothetical protein
MQSPFSIIHFVLALSACSTALPDRSLPNAAFEIEARGGASAPVRPLGCLITGESRLFASRARVRSDIEIVASDTRLGVAFATGPNEAVAMDLDPSSGGAMHSLARHSSLPIRRTIPLLGEGGTLDIAIDTDRLPNHLERSRTVPMHPPFVIGMQKGFLDWASGGNGVPQALWQLPEGPIQELQAIELQDEKGFAIMFRQADSLWFGPLDSHKEPTASLSKIAERPGMRWPTFAESGGIVLFAWAEMRGGEQWLLGGASVELGSALRPAGIELPTGGLAGDQILPALGALGGRRFVLVWTEGVASLHQVRATTLDARGAAVGPGLVVSSSEDAGWGRPAVTSDGRGAVAYVAPRGDGYAAFATPIACPPTPAERATRNGVSRTLQ